MYDETISLGVAVFLPYCSFEVEISRATVVETVKEIDGYLDNIGISKFADDRIAQVITTSETLSSKLAHGTIDPEIATAELAYNFVYAFVKKHEDQLQNMRGIIGVVKNDQLYIEGYKDQQSYKDCSDTLKSMSDNDDEVENITPTRTIH